MRTIMFRAKRIDNDEWIHGSYIKRDRSYIDSCRYNSDGVPYPCFIEVDPETLCQYIGLDDTYGTKIFEGDILETPIKIVGTMYGHLIITTDIRECAHMALYLRDYKVIGNVYDNPGLVEREEIDL